MTLAGRGSVWPQTRRGHLACAYLRPSDRQARARLAEMIACATADRDWERSMPTTAGGVRSRRRSDRDLAGGISPCANGPRNWLAYADVFERTPGSRVCDVSIRVLPEFPFVAEVAF